MTYRIHIPACFSGVLLAALSPTLASCDGNDSAATSKPTPTPDGTSSEPYAASAIQAVLNIPGSALNYSSAGPAHFAQLDNTPATNPTTDAGATLGRVLFYDPKLSINDTISCASCHQQAVSFTDPDRFSTGFDGGLTARNSMSLINERYYLRGRMFWDERAATLEDQVLQPIQNEVEMGMTLDALVVKLEATGYYPLLFSLAFGDSTITSERISLALAQFVRSIVSSESRFDAALIATGPPFNPNAGLSGLSAEENLGMQLFFAPAQQGGANCAICHFPPNPLGPPLNIAGFFANVPHNNGLDATSTTDKGVGGVSGVAAEEGRFKSPSLRNVALTGPYMHDGRFATLRAVIEHYNSGVQAHPNLDPRLRQGPGGPPQQLDLTAAEIDAVEAFLDTLTDTSITTDVRFSDPFRH